MDLVLASSFDCGWELLIFLQDGNGSVSSRFGIIAIILKPGSFASVWSWKIGFDFSWGWVDVHGFEREHLVLFLF